MADPNWGKIAREWREAKTVIEELLKELRPDLSKEQLDHNSSALIARLAHKKMIIETVED